MRLVITGAGPDGRSGVARVMELEPGGPGIEFSSNEVWGLPEVVSAFGDRPRSATHRPVGCQPGAASWRFVRYPPHKSFDVHRTDTVDIDVVMDGQVELGLEDGSIDLATGDMVVIPGVAHAWRAGPEGCTLSALLLGIEP
jgi:mannose-6-phosphate isomerase-like protein (cupin superfamily)